MTYWQFSYCILTRRHFYHVFSSFSATGSISFNVPDNHTSYLKSQTRELPVLWVLEQRNSFRDTDPEHPDQKLFRKNSFPKLVPQDRIWDPLVERPHCKLRVKLFFSSHLVFLWHRCGWETECFSDGEACDATVGFDVLLHSAFSYLRISFPSLDVGLYFLCTKTYTIFLGILFWKN